MYRSIFINPKLSAVKLFFFHGYQQLNAKMAANSNLALILGHPLYMHALKFLGENVTKNELLGRNDIGSIKHFSLFLAREI